MAKKKQEKQNSTKEGGQANLDFTKVKIGLKTLEDATLKIGSYRRINPRLGDKRKILEAIHRNDYAEMREISHFFYKTSGIYSRLIRYMSNLYKYDWLVTPYINSKNVSNEKIITDFNKVLNYLDNSGLKSLFSKIAKDVFLDGCYYGYINEGSHSMQLQKLPIRYCRSRFNGPDGRPVIEFNMRFFDDCFKDTVQKMKMLQLFDPEFSEGYIAYKQGKLVPDFPGDENGWYLLNPKKTVKFNVNGDDYPLFIAVIPMIIDLDDAQDLDRQKMAQQLLKIIIQTMPIDKNGDLVFDVDEARVLHNNVVGMLQKAIGVDVLTTFADVKVEDLMSDDNSTALDQLVKVERAVFNEAGIAQNVFNSDGGLALDKSVLNDESLIIDLIRQFEMFLNCVVDKFNSSNKITFKAQILNTTIYNYERLSQTYQAQTQIGFSKVLPQIALGQSQSAILATVQFENDVLDLVHKFIPPMSSSVMSNAAVQTLTGGKSVSSNGGKVGRPTNESKGESVSEKTIQNRESES